MTVGAEDDQWTLTPEEHALVMSKHGGTRLGFAILLAFFRNRGRFPQHDSEVDRDGIFALSQQLNVPVPVDGEEFLVGRTARRLRAEIRVRFGFREATVADAHTLIEVMIERLESRCRELAIEPPTAERVDRIVRAAPRAHEDRFHVDVHGRLSPVVRERLDELLGPAKGEGDRTSLRTSPAAHPRCS